MKTPLFCFPHAGGNSTAFHAWKRYETSVFTVVPVSLPARMSRIDEPMPTEITRLVDQLEAELPWRQPGPIALFGHSFGAVVAYEFARRIESRQPVSHLFASACHAPHQFRDHNRSLGEVSDAELIAELEKRGGSPKAILENPALCEMYLTVLRSDFRLMDHYAWKAGPSLAFPITAFTGETDPAVTREHIAEWGKLTSASFFTKLFPGGHFYLMDLTTPVLKTVEERISDSRVVSLSMSSN